MKKILAIATVLLAWTTAHSAQSKLEIKAMDIVRSVVLDSQTTQGLDWKTGESADHKLDMGFLKGDMHSFVREETAKGFWVQQDIKLGFAGDQKMEVLYDKATGQVLEIIQNGKKVDLPDAGDVELVEMKESEVTVPAGTFECIYAKIKNKKDNKISEAWINPEKIPLGGMIKTVAPSQFGKVTLVLTKFEKK